MKRRLNLQGKIILITIGLLFLAMAFTTVVSVVGFRNDYLEVVISRSEILGRDLRSEIETFMDLGLGIDQMAGMDEMLREFVDENQNVAYFGIMNLDGKVLYHSDPEFVGEILSDPVSQLAATTKSPLTQYYRWVDGESYYDTTIAILDAQGNHLAAIRLGFPAEVVRGKLAGLVVKAVIVMVISFLAASGLLVLFISGGITGPIKRLVKGSEEIGQGNYDYRIEATSGDEIGYLGESFNRMAGNLKSSQESLVRKIAELNSLNKVGEVINSTLDLEEILNFILEKALEFSGASSGFLVLSAQGQTELSAAQNVKDEEKSILFELAEEVYLQTVEETGADVIDVFDSTHAFERKISKTPLKNLLALPLISHKLSLGAMGIYNRASREDFTLEDIQLLSGLAHMAVSAIQKDSLYRENLEKQAIEKELAIAHDIQMKLLPVELPKIKGYEISSRCVPASSVGGDLYDLIPLGKDHLGVIIGDVVGHGVAAALLMAITKSVLQIESLRPGTDGKDFYPPHEVMMRTNDILYREFSDPTKFVTLFYGVLDLKSKEFTYSNAGHNYPLLFKSNGETLALGEGGTIAGCFSGSSYDLGRVNLSPGDILGFYTDGMVEIGDKPKARFGMDKLKKLIQNNFTKPASEIIDRLFGEVGNGAQNDLQRDDMTMVLVKILKD